MSLWKGASKVKTNRNSENIIPGDYLAEVLSLKLNPPNHENRTFFIAEFKVLESDVATLPPNSVMAWKNDMYKVSLEFQVAKVKALFAALDGIKEPDSDETVKMLSQHTALKEWLDKGLDPWAALIEYGISAANPYQGDKVRISARLTKTKEKTDFTVINWYPKDYPMPKHDALIPIVEAPSLPA